MIEIENNTDKNINLPILDEILDSLSKKELELIFVEDEQMRDTNKTFRDIDKTTDVLSFPLEQSFDFEPLGTIMINVDYAQKTSKKLNHTFEEEISILFIHGLLHLLGFDHESDDGEMFKKEEELALKFSLPTTLIKRVQND